MRSLISIFIIFTIAIRPVLPLVNYAVNYDYITKNLCENKDRPQLMCKGKCYLEKELSNSEKQSRQNSVKISNLDVFISRDIISFTADQPAFHIPTIEYSEYDDHYSSQYFSDIFHPPLA